MGVKWVGPQEGFGLSARIGPQLGATLLDITIQILANLIDFVHEERALESNDERSLIALIEVILMFWIGKPWLVARGSCGCPFRKLLSSRVGFRIKERLQYLHRVHLGRINEKDEKLVYGSTIQEYFWPKYDESCLKGFCLQLTVTRLLFMNI